MRENPSASLTTDRQRQTWAWRGDSMSLHVALREKISLNCRSYRKQNTLNLYFKDKTISCFRRYSSIFWVVRNK